MTRRAWKSQLAPLLLLILSPSAFGEVMFPCIFTGGTHCISATTSQSRSQTVDTTFETARTDTFQTRITGQIEGGPTLFDQTFALPFSSLAVQNALLEAQAALQAAATSPLTFLNPFLVSSSVLHLGDSTATVVNSQTQTEAVSTEETLGPGTIFHDDRGTCADFIGSVPTGCTPGLGTPYELVISQININLNTHTHTQIFQTTTTTSNYQTFQHYNLAGVPLAASEVPEPASAALAAGGIAVIWWKRRRRASAR